jgi:hypothetical protein
MTITLALAGAAMTLWRASFKVRSRENRKMDAIADAQRGINLMTREIANAGFGLNNNGIVVRTYGELNSRPAAISSPVWRDNQQFGL